MSTSPQWNLAPPNPAVPWQSNGTIWPNVYQAASLRSGPVSSPSSSLTSVPDKQVTDLLSLTISKIQANQLHLGQQQQASPTSVSFQHQQPAAVSQPTVWAPQLPRRAVISPVAQQPPQPQPQPQPLQHNPLPSPITQQRKAAVAKKRRTPVAQQPQSAALMLAQPQSSSSFAASSQLPSQLPLQAPASISIAMAATVEEKMMAISSLRKRASETLELQSREQMAAMDAVNNWMQTLMSERNALLHRISTLERSLSEERQGRAQAEKMLEQFRSESVDIFGRIRGQFGSMSEQYRREMDMAFNLTERFQRLLSDAGVPAGSPRGVTLDSTSVPAASPMMMSSLASSMRDQPPSMQLQGKQPKQRQKPPKPAPKAVVRPAVSSPQPQAGNFGVQPPASPQLSSALDDAGLSAAIETAQEERGTTAKKIRASAAGDRRGAADGYESPDDADVAPVPLHDPIGETPFAEPTDLRTSLDPPMEPAERPRKTRPASVSPTPPRQSTPRTSTSTSTSTSTNTGTGALSSSAAAPVASPVAKPVNRAASPGRVPSRASSTPPPIDSVPTSSPVPASPLLMSPAARVADTPDPDDFNRLVWEMNRAIQNCEAEVAAGID
eukprot:TRINITY_DN728_c1_g2_i1.p1 TRINITY_DN728_c1_g2~~TRINITY_DN728_c1_g2_i1.p1  ORF type:complete len:611 (+),score=100.54 TRINITY_DN728_c1_g2_i1:73-1905(+)